MISQDLHQDPRPKANETELQAIPENLQQVLDFVDSFLDGTACSVKIRMQIAIAVEEVFVNIAHYAYRPRSGTARIRTEITGEPAVIRITFEDSGKPFDPLEKKDPNIMLSAEERQIGGLGIFMTKKLMDHLEYQYKDGRNILTLQKGLQ